MTNAAGNAKGDGAEIEPSFAVECECGNHYSLHNYTVCPQCFLWPKHKRNKQVEKAFDLIAAANGVTFLSLGEAESMVNRALSGEFDDEASHE